MEPAEGFQIWFEPHLSQAVKRAPTYSLFDSNQFALENIDGVQFKTLLGNNSPMQIVTDAQMWDVLIPQGTVYTHRLSLGRTLASLAIRGEGTLLSDTMKATHFSHKDFIIVQSEQEERVAIQAHDQDLRMLLIEVPTEVDYPLYSKPS